MCQFISWKEYKGKSYFLTDSDLNTKEGRELLKPEYKADIKGHGAIEHYYPELKGKGHDKECTDFSTPANFPKEIVKAIKEGRFVNFGICEQILNEKGKAEYLRIKQPAYAKYEKIQQSARVEYKKIQQPAYAKYEKIQQSAYAKYKKIEQPAWAEYLKIQQSAYIKYLKIQQPAYAEYLKTEQPAWAEYLKTEQPAWAEYLETKKSALTEYLKTIYTEFWKIARQKKYRSKEWK